MSQYFSSQEILKRCFNSTTGRLKTSNTYNLQDYLNAIFDANDNSLRIEGAGGGGSSYTAGNGITIANGNISINTTGANAGNILVFTPDGVSWTDFSASSLTNVIQSFDVFPVTTAEDVGKIIFYYGDDMDGQYPIGHYQLTATGAEPNIVYDWVPIAMMGVLTTPLILPVDGGGEEPLLINIYDGTQDIRDSDDLDNNSNTPYCIKIDGYVLSVEAYPSNDDAFPIRYYADMQYDSIDNKTSVFLTTEDYAHISGLNAGKNVLIVNYLGNPAFAALLATKEDAANKTQEIDAEDPSAYKFPSEAAVVAYVPTDISDLTDTTGILAGKVDVDGEKVLSDNNYTTAEKAKVAAALTSVPDATSSVKGIVQLATAEEATAGTDQNKAITPATLRPLVDAKENVANKTQEIDAVTPSADKYTSEAAVVAHVAGLIPDVPDDLSDLTDTTGVLAGKVDKVTGYGLSENDYTDAAVAKVAKIEFETLAELIGADVSVAPWTQSKWSASGTCSLTASGWAASGHQIAYIVITLAAGATTSIIGTEEVAEDDALSAAGVYECYIKNVDGKKYFRVISFTEAAS